MYDIHCVLKILNEKGYTIKWMTPAEMDSHPFDTDKLKGNEKLEFVLQKSDVKVPFNIKSIKIQEFKIREIYMERVLLIQTDLKVSDFSICLSEA